MALTKREARRVALHFATSALSDWSQNLWLFGENEEHQPSQEDQDKVLEAIYELIDALNERSKDGCEILQRICGYGVKDAG